MRREASPLLRAEYGDSGGLITPEFLVSVTRLLSSAPANLAIGGKQTLPGHATVSANDLTRPKMPLSSKVKKDVCAASGCNANHIFDAESALYFQVHICVFSRLCQTD